mmetsp:Transcript_28933/g.51694  ORF Transcript_28933/g.51694 Transcript_28933/m.51694 type:complete len:336 (+) Transcript_28933:2734-3741(+)
MAVRLRLRQQGLRNHPYWWIIAQPHKVNPQGRYIEHLGFWIPRECKTVERAIILNRPRLKYWLSVGAIPTDGVMHLMGLADFLPRRPPKYGTSTLYELAKPAPEKPGVELMKKYGKAVALNLDQAIAIEKAREEIRAKEMTFQSGLSLGLKDMGLDVPKESAEEVQNLMDTYKKLLEATERKIPGVTNDQRARLYDLLESKVTLGIEPPASIEDIMSALRTSQEDAEEIMLAYYTTGTMFTFADIEGNLSEIEVDKQKLGKFPPIKGPGFIMPPLKPITPIPNLLDDREDEKPLAMFMPPTSESHTRGPLITGQIRYFKKGKRINKRGSPGTKIK